VIVFLEAILIFLPSSYQARDCASRLRLNISTRTSYSLLFDFVILEPHVDHLAVGARNSLTYGYDRCVDDRKGIGCLI
jgi:hypothetical protein